jgi:hypothetical protein
VRFSSRASGAHAPARTARSRVESYYLFLTLADGYWRSTDLLAWTFITPNRWPFESEVANADARSGRAQDRVRGAGGSLRREWGFAIERDRAFAQAVT